MTDIDQDDLLSGWQTAFRLDETDPRYVTLTCRHPKVAGDELPPDTEGERAQIQLVAFAVAVCASFGVIADGYALETMKTLARRRRDLDLEAAGLVTGVPLVATPEPGN